MDQVKGEPLEAFDRSIDVHVSRIRQAIEDDVKHPAAHYHGAWRGLCFCQGTRLKRLYLRIYFAVLAVLAVLALAAGLLWNRFEEHGPQARVRDSLATLAANALPAAEASPAAQQAALEKLLSGVRADVTLYAANRERIASVGAALPLLRWSMLTANAFPCRRAAAQVVRLADGRWVVARTSFGRPPRGKGGAPLWMTFGVLPVAGVAGARHRHRRLSVVRRLTGRLERLQTGVEALGAGTLSTRVKVEGHDEVARLAESFNQAAAHIEKLVGAHKTLLANASHELRTPAGTHTPGCGAPEVRCRCCAQP